ncbi:alpha-xenorhabdolysin family binary toxin subunit A [Pseudomonas sp. KU26590]|uniref:alpha-xenorhabdolysin family binary toxin subunit A n=1 Tax=Pseudomonas sp. KU26590 TaxID=2991051 RepID=UPI00223C9829|nr:alpha-xenorhabdolysin family binary toxin subunit A [Pseudomonas sp. KU26590]UZJ59734.1 alpha-xenorhabdolysin family binary toxin subunit A [Pseudomonas sp. KU26590]
MSQSEQDLITVAATAPEALFSSSVATPETDTRDTGLILTKDQIKSLKKYEIAGLALPTELKDVIAYLGYESGAGKGLEATDFQETFQLVNGHARLWNPLRTDMLTVNTKLAVFAESVGTYHEAMEDVFKSIKALELVDEHGINTLEDLRKFEINSGITFPDIKALDRSDLGYFLDQILEKIKEQAIEATRIKERLKTFGEALDGKVLFGIKQKLSLMDNHSVGSEIKALQVKIDERSTAIDDKNKEYKELVMQAVGSVFGNLAMLIYSSVEAEKIRKERNRLSNEQEKDIALMDQKNRILASLGRVRMDFQNLDLVVIDADIATKNLITVWNSLHTFIAASATEIKDIHDGLSMRRFRNQFNLVVKPWETIKVDAKKLEGVFAAADREFKEEYGV